MGRNFDIICYFFGFYEMFVCFVVFELIKFIWIRSVNLIGGGKEKWKCVFSSDLDYFGFGVFNLWFSDFG